MSQSAMASVHFTAATGTPLTCSVEGYVNEARHLSTTDPVELALFNALLIYVDSVAAAG